MLQKLFTSRRGQWKKSALPSRVKVSKAACDWDHVFEFEGDVRVFVDPKSIIFLDGMTLDWHDSLMQSGFVFQNPHATKSCGCGTSFSA